MISDGVHNSRMMDSVVEERTNPYQARNPLSFSWNIMYLEYQTPNPVAKC